MKHLLNFPLPYSHMCTYTCVHGSKPEHGKNKILATDFMHQTERTSILCVFRLKGPIFILLFEVRAVLILLVKLQQIHQRIQQQKQTDQFIFLWAEHPDTDFQLFYRMSCLTFHVHLCSQM